jgi:hypothetical protein
MLARMSSTQPTRRASGSGDLTSDEPKHEGGDEHNDGERGDDLPRGATVPAPRRRSAALWNRIF